MSQLSELKIPRQEQSQLSKELDQLILDIRSLDPKSNEYSRLCLSMANKLNQMPNQ